LLHIKELNKQQIKMLKKFITPLKNCNKEIDNAIHGIINVRDAVAYNEHYHKWLKSVLMRLRKGDYYDCFI